MDSISVIIPTHNRAPYLRRCVDSVLSQDYSFFEIIVIDDGSTDGTREVLEKYISLPNFKYFYQPNSGVSTARNLGIQKSLYPWVAFLDSDDEWNIKKLSHQMKVIECNQDALIVHTDETWLRNGKFLNQMKKHQKYGGFIYEKCLCLCAISPSSVLIHKNIFADIGTFNEKFPVCEDYELWLRICVKYPVYFCEEKLVIKNGGHEDQLSRRFFAMDFYRIQALGNMLLNPHLTSLQRTQTLETMASKYRILKSGASKHGNLKLQKSLLEFSQIYPCVE